MRVQIQRFHVTVTLRILGPTKPFPLVRARSLRAVLNPTREKCGDPYPTHLKITGIGDSQIELIPNPQVCPWHSESISPLKIGRSPGTPLPSSPRLACDDPNMFFSKNEVVMSICCRGVTWGDRSWDWSAVSTGQKLLRCGE